MDYRAYVSPVSAIPNVSTWAIELSTFTLMSNFAGSGEFSSISLRNQFMETQIFADLMSESVFETPSSRCSSADVSIEGSESPFPAAAAGDYCTSPDSSTNSHNVFNGYNGSSGENSDQTGRRYSASE